MHRAAAFLLIGAVTLAARPGSLQPSVSPSRNPPALTGQVLTPGGEPVTEGTVRLRWLGNEVETVIERTGRFAVMPVQPGSHDVQISVPGFAVHRLKVGVPATRALALPPIRLSVPTFLKMHVLSPAGEPMNGVRVLRESFEVTGQRIAERPGEQADVATDDEGITTVGPLPRGMSIVVIDTPPYAPWRLPDVRVNGDKQTIDAGTIRLPPDLVLNVDLLDGTGAPVAGQEVYLDDGLVPSPLMRPAVRSTPAGRARFERLGPGRYRIRTRVSRRCGMYTPFLERWTTVGGEEPVNERLTVDGIELTLRVTSGGAPLPSAEVSVIPETTPPIFPPWLRSADGRFSPTVPPWPSGDVPCPGMTDADGHAVFRFVPSGRARVEVRILESTWVRHVNVPLQDGSLALDVPTGVASLRVRSPEGSPVFAAAITWTSGGSRVQATVPSNGDLLLGGVPDGPATLSVRASGYVPFELKLPAPPDALFPVTLQRPPEMALRCEVIAETGKRISGAAVELVPADSLEVSQVAGTDEKGFVRFGDLSRGAVRLTATAPGFAPSAPVSVAVPRTVPGAVVLKLSPAH